jgi:hypothetical protein
MRISTGLSEERAPDVRGALEGVEALLATVVPGSADWESPAWRR